MYIFTYKIFQKNKNEGNNSLVNFNYYFDLRKKPNKIPPTTAPIAT